MIDRRTRRWHCLLATVALAVAGCQNDRPEGPKLRPWWDQAPPSSTAARPAARATHAEPPAEPKVNPLAKLFGLADTSGGAADGNYTISLAVCRSPSGHVRQAKDFKRAAEHHTGWKNLFIVHREDYSVVYWGKYRAVADAKGNLRKAKAYRTPAKIPVFVKALIVPLPGKEDTGPPEWQLGNTPERYVYTVMVADFYDVPEADYLGRRKFAVEYCRQLRQKNIPAYYRHDPASSVVTVGLFGRSAVMVTRKGRKFQRDVRDPRIKSIFARFPDLAVNGRQKLLRTINAKTKKIQNIPAPTYLMRIPRERPQHGTARRSRPGGRPGHAQPGKAPGNSASTQPAAGASGDPRGLRRR